MVTANETLISPNDVVIDKITMTSMTGEEFDLSSLMSEINVYEDLFGNGMTGNIVLTDSVNLFNHVPIIGQEIITLSFHTPVIDSKVKKDSGESDLKFQVYKISNRALNKERSQVYMLHFATIPTIKNALTKISKTYTGQISNMVNDIIFDELDSELDTVFATSGSYRFIIPYWSPYKTINFLAKKAKTSAKGDDTNYVFYEDRDGFHFYPISQLLLEREIEDQYAFAPFRKTGDDLTKESVRNITKPFFAIKDYKILDAMDTLQAINGGMFASRLISYDMITKKITNYDFNYLDSFDQFVHINDKGQSNPLTVDIENPVTGFKFHHKDFYNSKIHRFDTHQDQYSDITTSQNPEEYLMQRGSLLEQLNMHRIRIRIAGNSTLRPGDVMTITLPSPETMTTEFKHDSLVTGKYIITAIRHKIQKGNYENVIEMSKNSFFDPIPEKSQLPKE